jgi:murein endopeptidase
VVVRVAALLSLVGLVGTLVAVTLDADAQAPAEARRATAPPATSAPAPTEPQATGRSPGTEPEPVDPRPAARWRSRARGVAVAHPSGWSLRTAGGEFVNPGLCLELSSDRRSGVVDLHASTAPEDGVEVRVVESFGGARGRDLRRPFSLGRLAAPGAADWTSGGIYTFRQHGRWILVGVAVGSGASAATRAQAERAVQSLSVARSGRCLPPRASEIAWRRSNPLGLPHAGRLVGGVELPAEGHHFFTWDPILRRSPDRPGRRWGAAGVVRTTLAIVNAFAAAHPEAPRIGIGDLSRERGGYFGPKHVSHQNGLDVDVYYPRKDRRERPPARAADVDRRLAQDLVDRFVAAGATRVFVGPNVRLTGPRGIVEPLWNHDNHLHARFPPRRA